MDKDIGLQEYIIEALRREPGINAAHIGVEVDDGVVTLSGHVRSNAEKHRIEQIAGTTPGARALAGALEVRLPDHKQLADDEIAARALKVFEWDELVPAERIQIKVERGVVTLSGEVDWEYQKSAAGDDVFKLSGVAAVRNDIAVSATAAEPAVLRRNIVESFRGMVDADAHRIEIAVEGHRVTLSGRVHAAYERELAERAAWAVPGVSAVNNRIAVG